MGLLSLSSDIEERALDYALATAVLEDRFKPGRTVPWGAQKKPQPPKISASKSLKARRAEAEAARLEKWTRDFAEGQLLWRMETADVNPLRRK